MGCDTWEETCALDACWAFGSRVGRCALRRRRALSDKGGKHAGRGYRIGEKRWEELRVVGNECSGGSVDLSTAGGFCSGNGSAFGWVATFCGDKLRLTIGGGEDGDYAVDAGPSTDMGDVRSEEELVYAMGVNRFNRLERRIAIIFREGIHDEIRFRCGFQRIAFVKALNPKKFNGSIIDPDDRCQRCQLRGR